VITLDAPLAIVDLETTGGSPGRDRVTEIAVIEVDGFAVTSQWSTLVNPEIPIPASIQSITGISDDMVAGAPRFGQLAGELAARLAGRVFVAHNARFDYGFLRREFERTGRGFLVPTVCTVRLSRRLYPGQWRHDLDSLIERHGLACRARHRAHGDADAVWQFLRVAAADHGAEVVSVAARQVATGSALPAHIERALIDAIPESAGVYLLYGEGPAPLYIGKGAALRTRVLAHFSPGRRSGKALRLAQAVRRIEWQRSAGALGACLRAAQLIRQHAPAYNSRRDRVPSHGEPEAWPHGGPLGIVERDRDGESSEVHVFDRWCYLGTATSEAELGELLEARGSRRFDYGHYRILVRHLAKRGVRMLRLSC
jgi:DNA polymerase III subunit epsilon